MRNFEHERDTCSKLMTQVLIYTSILALLPTVFGSESEAKEPNENAEILLECEYLRLKINNRRTELRNQIFRHLNVWTDEDDEKYDPEEYSFNYVSFALDEIELNSQIKDFISRELDEGITQCTIGGHADLDCFLTLTDQFAEDRVFYDYYDHLEVAASCAKDAKLDGFAEAPKNNEDLVSGLGMASVESFDHYDCNPRVCSAEKLDIDLCLDMARVEADLAERLERSAELVEKLPRKELRKNLVCSQMDVLTETTCSEMADSPCTQSSGSIEDSAFFLDHNIFACCYPTRGYGEVCGDDVDLSCEEIRHRSWSTYQRNRLVKLQKAVGVKGLQEKYDGVFEDDSEDK